METTPEEDFKSIVVWAFSSLPKVPYKSKIKNIADKNNYIHSLLSNRLVSYEYVFVIKLIISELDENVKIIIY